MRFTRTITVAAVAAQCAAIGGLSAANAASPTPAAAATPTASVAVRHLEGTVLSVDRAARAFRLRDSERGTFRITVTARTRFERVAGFAGLRAGMTRIEVTAWRSSTGWRAVEVERSGGGGRHGGEDDRGGSGRGGHDDGPNHT